MICTTLPALPAPLAPFVVVIKSDFLLNIILFAFIRFFAIAGSP
jgi:hypothetical protein